MATVRSLSGACIAACRVAQLHMVGGDGRDACEPSAGNDAGSVVWSCGSLEPCAAQPVSVEWGDPCRSSGLGVPACHSPHTIPEPSFFGLTASGL